MDSRYLPLRPNGDDQLAALVRDFPPVRNGRDRVSIGRGYALEADGPMCGVGYVIGYLDRANETVVIYPRKER